MQSPNGWMHPATRILSVAVVMAVLAAAVSAQSGPWAGRFMGGPVTLEDQGSFFVGGVPKVTDHTTAFGDNPSVPHQITIGQMYVQFQIPASKYATGWPVIMVHGSSHTGAALEATPDGREGWYPYFVRKGVPSFVVDQSGRGRSGFDQSVIVEGLARLDAGDAAGAARLIPGLPRITDDAAMSFWFGHFVPDGSHVLNGRLVPHADAEDSGLNPDDTPHAASRFPIEAVDPSIAARAGAIGPEPVGPDALLALEYYKQLVPNTEVTLPGSVCDPCDPQELSPANTWTPRNLATLVEQLGGAIVVTHSQSGIMGHHTARLLKERGHLDLLKGLITVEGGCSLTASGLTAADFDEVPYMALKGDYAQTSAACQETVDAINARRAASRGAARADYLKLDELGILGVTHMMMLDKNSLEIADIIYDWIGEHVPARND